LKAFLSCIAGLRKENLPTGRQESQKMGAKGQFFSQLKKFKPLQSLNLMSKAKK
jgi:hypothetical protein